MLTEQEIKDWFDSVGDAPETTQEEYNQYCEEKDDTRTS